KKGPAEAEPGFYMVKGLVRLRLACPPAKLRRDSLRACGACRAEARSSPRARGGWWAHQALNLEPADYEAAALTVELWARRKDEVRDSRRPSFEERAKLARPRGMPQLPERLRFDLPDALARDGEALADFLERVLAAVADAEAHLDHLLLA